MKVVLSPEFMKRLKETERYISEQLCSPKAAAASIDRILDACSNLSFFPEMGRIVERPDGRTTNFRILIIGYKIALYHIRGDTVYLVNLYDSRTDEKISIPDEARKAQPDRDR